MIAVIIISPLLIIFWFLFGLVGMIVCFPIYVHGWCKLARPLPPRMDKAAPLRNVVAPQRNVTATQQNVAAPQRNVAAPQRNVDAPPRNFDAVHTISSLSEITDSYN
jgi:hypothetical protein